MKHVVYELVQRLPMDHPQVFQLKDEIANHSTVPDVFPHRVEAARRSFQ